MTAQETECQAAFEAWKAQLNKANPDLKADEQDFKAGWNAALDTIGKELADAAKAYRDLATLYRLGKRPSEKLHKALENADAALSKYRGTR